MASVNFFFVVANKDIFLVRNRYSFYGTMALYKDKAEKSKNMLLEKEVFILREILYVKQKAHLKLSIVGFLFTL